jgi:hypothetical protein
MARIEKLNILTRATAGAAMIVRDLTGEPNDDGEAPALLAVDGTPATLTLLGADSPQAKRQGYHKQAAAQNRLYANAFSGKKGKKGATVTPDDIAEQEADDLETLVALTVGWHGFEDSNDKPIAFSAEEVRSLYASSPMIREQALEFISQRANFFEKSPTRFAISSSTNSSSAAEMPPA